MDPRKKGNLKNSKPMRFIVPGFCECGCGMQVGISHISKVAQGLSKGKPVKFVNGHSGFRYDPPRYVCACGCERLIPNPTFKRYNYISGHKVPSKIKQRQCPACGEWHPFGEFPPYSKDFDVVCRICQRNYRMQTLYADRILSGEPILCKCGCGAPVKTNDKGIPINDFFGDHGQPRIYNGDEDPIYVNRGYQTDCLERPLLRSSKRGKIMLNNVKFARNVRHNPITGLTQRDSIPSYEWAWEQENGPLQKGEYLMHCCHNLACERLDHLFKIGNPVPEEPKEDTYVPEVEPGFCRCGCGTKVGFYSRTNKKLGQIAGQPVFYAPGHNSRVKKWGRGGVFPTLIDQFKTEQMERERLEREVKYSDKTCEVCGKLFRHDQVEYQKIRGSKKTRIICFKCAAGERTSKYTETTYQYGSKTATVASRPKKEKPPMEKVIGPHGWSMIPKDGRCLCGCGQITAIASVNMPEQGIIVGEHYPFIRGHGKRFRQKQIQEYNRQLQELDAATLEPVSPFHKKEL